MEWSCTIEVNLTCVQSLAEYVLLLVVLTFRFANEGILIRCNIIELNLIRVSLVSLCVYYLNWPSKLRVQCNAEELS